MPIVQSTRVAGFFLLVFVTALTAAEPFRVPYQCTEADMDALGLTCTAEEPCPVFLELASAEAAGGRMMVAGNLHTKNVTMFGIVLASEDNGATWTDAHERI